MEVLGRVAGEANVKPPTREPAYPWRTSTRHGVADPMKVRSTLFLGLAAAALAAPAVSHAGVISRADAGAAPADLR